MSAGLPSPALGADFLISCSNRERQWAEWVAWELESAGFRVRLWSRDVLPGENFVLWTGRQLGDTRFLVALYSPAYFQSGRCMSELSFGLRRGILLPFRVVPCQPPEMLGVTMYETLFGLAEQAARRRLLRAARASLGSSVSVSAEPERGGGGRPTFPGSPRPVRKAPARNAWFVGREQPLASLRGWFRSADPHRLTTIALTGVAGAGKTQLAIEYTHRYGDAYSLVWWLPAALPEALREALDALADVLGLPDDHDRARRARRALRCLSQPSDWLLVFDDVRRPELLAEWLPDGNGHVLVTGRSRVLRDFGQTLEIGSFTPEESRTLLRGRATHLLDDDAARVADALDHLPLAVGQAGVFLDTTKVTASSYLALLKDATIEVLAHGPVDYPAGLVGSVTTAMTLLRESEPLAACALREAAFLAPQPLPPVVLRALAQPVAEIKATGTGTEGMVARMLRGVESSGLARVDGGTFQLHRLTQAVIRDGLEESDRAWTVDRIRARIADATPTAPDDPTTWPVYGALAAHLLTLLEHVSDGGSGFRAAVLDIARYLTRSGQYDSALACAARAAEAWRDHRGEDHRDVLAAAHCHAEALRASGRCAEAEQSDRLTHERRLATLGRLHRETLLSADALAVDQWRMGRRREALRGHSRAYRAARRAFGPDDHQTLELASNLALDLYGLGNTDAARALDEQTLARRRELLGDEHPATLASARSLAHDLRKLRAHHEALALDSETFTVSQRVLGTDHPDTLLVASSLAVDHYATGD
ncbi:FxSxx-COOH system tetratricopeptide repeat protein [Parafrankia discariae]|uniref:FxSxx-COOH system tetratricopeptide repeat protein n=1 Tax=Parafrankia discariae TaxID=365528 RepID=UPI0003A93CDC|nr:FxSxx-COOH system tetratricopeptide repeat protein [Parafrankia discariae]